MKIIINNEREREVVELFSEFIADWIDAKELQKIIIHADYEFQAHEIELISNGFRSAQLVVDEKERSIGLESENITGICKFCGEQWQGVEDVSEVDIEEYEGYENSETWHLDCFELVELNNGQEEAE